MVISPIAGALQAVVAEHVVRVLELLLACPKRLILVALLVELLVELLVLAQKTQEEQEGQQIQENQEILIKSKKIKETHCFSMMSKILSCVFV